MANDLRGFARQIRITGKAVEQNATSMLRRVAVAVDRTVVFATPVDTGRARANWQAQIGSPASGTVPPTTAEASVAAAQAVINNAKPGDTIHLTNNLPYIGKLNDGWSAQAPANFVQEAVAVGVQTAAEARLLGGTR
jgi:hypothetical protein